ncbi:hypothetical protein [Agarivorans sp. QJM3NY_25]|uniref:hypothetical protein n=1 Tax=Agarivorans sp. QJM3NY_25 TaxID=3421430 RepID=UPI003D7E2046
MFLLKLLLVAALGFGAWFYVLKIVHQHSPQSLLFSMIYSLYLATFLAWALCLKYKAGKHHG